MAGMYGFRGGPVFHGAPRHEVVMGAMETPLSVTSTLGSQVKQGFLDSYVAGLVTQQFTIPQGNETGDVPLWRRTSAPLVLYDTLRRWRQSTMDQGDPLDEAAYKASPFYRERIPWDAAMTTTRAAALAAADDARSVREFYGEKRPIASFIGQFIGQAGDPINYIPFVGASFRAASVARMGLVGGHIATTATDAALNTAVAGLLTASERARYGQDVSWQAVASEIAMAAAIGAGFGAIGGGWASYRASRNVRAVTETQRQLLELTDIQARLSGGRNDIQARIALNESIGDVVNGEAPRLGPNSTAAASAIAARVASDPRLQHTYIGETMAARLRSAGRPEDEAAALGRIVETVYTTLARRAGVSVDDLVNRVGIPEINNAARPPARTAKALTAGLEQADSPLPKGVKLVVGDREVRAIGPRGNEIGYVSLERYGDAAARNEVFNTAVKPAWRRKGLARAMYRAAEAEFGPLNPSRALSDDGFNFWKSFRPDAVRGSLRFNRDAYMGRNVDTPSGPAVVYSVGDAGLIARLPNGDTIAVPKTEIDRLRREADGTFAQSVPLRTGDETLARYGLEPGRSYTTREVATALEARQRKKYGTIARGDYSPKASRRIAKWIAEEVLFEVEQARMKPETSAVGWYSVKYQRAIDAMGEAFPELVGRGDLFNEAEQNVMWGDDPHLPGVSKLQTRENARSFFTALMAITSDGAKVADNFRRAGALYQEFRTTGRLSTDFTFGGDRNASVKANIRHLTNMLDTYGPEEMHRRLLNKAPVKELKEIAKAAGEKLNVQYKVDAELPYAAVMFGPKLGAFYANLMGDTGYLTMDRWWSRTFNRYRGTLLTAPNRTGMERFKRLVTEDRRLNQPAEMMTDDEALPMLAEYASSYAAKGFKDGSEIERAANTLYKATMGTEDRPFNASDREFMIDTAVRAQANLRRQGVDLTIADIQAVLWYYEKRLYGELGARQTKDISYEEIANDIAAERDFTSGPADEVAGDGEWEVGLDTHADAGIERRPVESLFDADFAGGATYGQSFAPGGREGVPEQPAAAGEAEPDGGSLYPEEVGPPPPGTSRWVVGRGGYIPVNADGMFRATHESPQLLDVVDPLKRRYVRSNQESLRLGPVGTKGITERAYYGVGDLNYVRPDSQEYKLSTDPYHGEGRGHLRHTVAVDPADIYNYVQDPLGLRAAIPTEVTLEGGAIHKVPDSEITTKYENAIREAGFKGTYHSSSNLGQVAMLFEPMRPEVVIDKRYNLPVGEIATPADFDAPTAELFTEKGGWAIITGVREADGPYDSPTNLASNNRLRNTLKKRGIKYKEVDGFYKGVDQGKSLLIFAPEAEARALGAAFGQESVLTRQGLEFTDGSGKIVSQVAKDTVIGEAARDGDFYSVLPDGTAFSVGLDFPPDVPPKLAGLPAASTGPIPRVVNAARDYAASIGIPLRRQSEYVKADPERGARIAAAYEAMAHAPNDPAVKAAYQAMIDETLAQYQFVKRSGLVVEAIEPGQADPYAGDLKAVLRDIDSGHLWFFPTDQGFGSSAADVSGNPLLAPTDEFIGDRQLLANDVFRIVHDFFGHGIEGSGFGARGEENAWQSHMRLYSERALPAVTSETRGQNSWVNFGPLGEANRADPANTVFADQKTGIMPEWTWREGVDDDGPADPDLLFQERPAVRGLIDLNDKPVITLFEAADPSTALHESAHLFLAMFRDIASKADAPEALKADWELVRKWWRDNAHAVAADASTRMKGITADDVRAVLDNGTTGNAAKDKAVDVGFHEQWARSFERYARDGVAPTPELTSVFQQFKDWLKKVYTQAKQLNVNLTPEMRGVFDRMLGADEPRAVDATPARPDPVPEGIAAAEARSASTEDTALLAEQFRVDPETGAFDEEADIQQLLAEGRLTEEDVAVLDSAKEDFDDSAAYGEAMKALVGCAI